jgi:hypothetical protein
MRDGGRLCPSSRTRLLAEEIRACFGRLDYRRALSYLCREPQRSDLLLGRDEMERDGDGVAHREHSAGARAQDAVRLLVAAA